MREWRKDRNVYRKAGVKWVLCTIIKWQQLPTRDQMFGTGGGVSSSQQETSIGLWLWITRGRKLGLLVCHFSKRKVVAITYTGTVLQILHGSDALVLDMALLIPTGHIHSALHLLLIHSLRTSSSPKRCGIETLSILLFKSLLMIEKSLRFMKIPFFSMSLLFPFSRPISASVLFLYFWNLDKAELILIAFVYVTLLSM